MTSAMAAHQDSIHERLQVTEEPYLHHESNWNQEQDENIDGPYYHLPKRNKRKNFKPRCAPNTNTSDEHTNTEVITESDVVDLSRRLSNESNEKKTNFDLKNPFAISQLIKNSPRRRDSDETKSDINANDRLDTDEVQQNGEGNKILRDYAVNTMKELLGIYGLSSNEVTDTISSQMRALEAIHGKGLQSVLLPVKRRHSSHESGRRSSSGTDDDRNSVTSPKTPDENEEQRQRTLQYLSQQSLRLFGRSYPGGRADDEDASCSEDGEQTLDLSVAASKECDGQDLSRNSSANNSLSEYEQKLMRKNMEDLANLQMQGYFPKSASLMDLEDSQEMRKLPTTGLLSALSQLDQARKIAGQASIDYSRYVKRYGSALECGSSYCKDLGYREHFHCLDCVTRVFCKKEEMIRHFKWHKKRDESLAHGFMRYSPLDDCSERYMDCPHNRSQTHYHCIQDGCDKVYISTSDVQMHANYHRKDSAILQEGFQRFRATETCTTSHCAFRGQRTTHFHCRRDGCTYTFKNKADMEKHKTYHIKDEQLARDGFKKYLKNEGCPYSGCRLSKVCNHIHCTRRACSYVLHSSSQLYTHKRKHERQDRDGITGFSGSPIVQSHVQGDSVTSPTNSFYNDGDDIINMATGTGSVDGDNGTGISSMEDIFEKYIDTFAGGKEPEDKCPKCSAFNKHYHCIAEGCNMEHSCHTTMTKHSLEHEHQQQITESYFMTYTTSNQCTNSACQHIRDITHYHCTWDNCSTVILSSEDQPFKRLEHYRQHAILKPISPNLAKLTPNLTTQLNHPTPLPNLAQLAQMAPNLVGHGLPTSLGLGPNPVGLPTQSLQHINAASSLDEMFSRKRGRPPKNRVVEVWTDNVTPQAIFTSFKLPKCNQTIIPNTALIPNAEEYSRIKFQNFEVFSAPDTCTQSYTNCQLKHSKLHLHCSLCPFSSENHPTMETHTRESHNITPLLVGFDYFNNYDHCNQSNCFKNQLRQHFHCNQVVNCNAILTQYSVVATHKHSKEEPDEIRDYSMKEREMADLGCVKEMDSFSVKEEPFEKDADGALNVSVVKATGTFYPSSHLKSSPSPSQVSSDASRTPDAKETSKYTGIPVPCTDQLCPLNKGTPSLHYHCNHCNQTYADLKSLYGHMIKKHSGSMDAATMGLAATKETLEREYPEISILPSTVTSSSMNTTEQPRTPNTAEQVQAVQSLLLQQYLSASSLQQHQNKKTSHQQQQAPSLQEQLKLQQQYNASMLPALSQAHLAQMAFLQGGEISSPTLLELIPSRTNVLRHAPVNRVLFLLNFIINACPDLDITTCTASELRRRIEWYLSYH